VLKSGSSDSGVKMVFQSFFMLIISIQFNRITQLTARLDEQAAQIQKVSAQLELNKPAPQTVMNKD
jgi:hypothetical protein